MVAVSVEIEEVAVVEADEEAGEAAVEAVSPWNEAMSTICVALPDDRWHVCMALGASFQRTALHRRHQ